MDELLILILITGLWLSLLILLSKFRYKSIIFSFFLGIASFISYFVFFITNPEIIGIAYNYHLDIFSEELFKSIFCYLLFLRYRPDLKNMLLVGASVGLGYAFAENIGYLSPIVAIRAVGSFVHMSMTMIVSYGIWKKFETSNRLWLCLIFLSTALHMGWNILVQIYW